MLSENPIWVLAGFKHLLFSVGDCDNLLALTVLLVANTQARFKPKKITWFKH